ncbi:MAG: transporter substrate-binding protein [Rhodoferax sp.]|jgi:polar amino acid transport system substrate-binding protein|nr:transporter substrate-binding protein [Rhodoferax sp.]
MDAVLVKQVAPEGVLRVSINVGNPVLASRSAPGAGPRGVSVDLARALAGRLGVALQPLVFESAGKSVDAIARGEADVGFFALDPARAAQLRFTPPYVLIEGAYLVKDASPLRAMEQVDAPGHRVVVGKGSAYDLYLSRELKHATIVRAATSPTVVDEFLRSGADVAAGVRQQLLADRERLGGLRLLPGNFMVIQQAMGVPAGRSDAALAMVRQFIEEMKADGFVARALKRHGVDGAQVAPAAAETDNRRNSMDQGSHDFAAPAGMAPPRGHYSHATRGAGLVFVSGQLPVAADGTVLADAAFDVQARQVLANVAAALRGAGSSIGQLLQVRVYIVDIAQWPAFNEIYAQWAGAARPARAVVPVPALHYGCMLEVEATALA